MNVLIVTGGMEPSKELLLEYSSKVSFIIGADRGCNVLYKHGITPDLIVGDFDSGESSVVTYYESLGVKVERFSKFKDYTDTHLAYNRAKELLDVETIYLLGATGSRLDHMLGNVGLFLNSLEDHIKLYIVDNNNIAWVTNKKTMIKCSKGKNLSFHSLSEWVKNFSIRGAMYTLEGYDMRLFEPRAISNEFLDGDVEIDFESGVVMILITND